MVWWLRGLVFLWLFKMFLISNQLNKIKKTKEQHIYYWGHKLVRYKTTFLRTGLWSWWFPLTINISEMLLITVKWLFMKSSIKRTFEIVSRYFTANLDSIKPSFIKYMLNEVWYKSVRLNTPSAKSYWCSWNCETKYFR